MESVYGDLSDLCVMQWKVTKRRGEVREAVPFYALCITLKECK